MINTVSSPPPLGDMPDRQSQSGQPPAPVPFEQRPEAAMPTDVVAADLRIIVEADPETGELTYTLMNRQTGAVTRLSKEDLLGMSQDSKYQSGALINTKA